MLKMVQKSKPTFNGELTEEYQSTAVNTKHDAIAFIRNAGLHKAVDKGSLRLSVIEATGGQPVPLPIKSRSSLVAALEYCEDGPPLKKLSLQFVLGGSPCKLTVKFCPYYNSFSYIFNYRENEGICGASFMQEIELKTTKYEGNQKSCKTENFPESCRPLFLNWLLGKSEG